jgi:hypothetical protein
MAEIPNKDLLKVGKLLNESMNDLLYGGGGGGGGGGPGGMALTAAASCFQCLKLLNLKIKYEKDIRLTLEGENVHSYNYIAGI